jgi:hypothetical protein
MNHHRVVKPTPALAAGSCPILEFEHLPRDLVNKGATMEVVQAERRGFGESRPAAWRSV